MSVLFFSPHDQYLINISIYPVDIIPEIAAFASAFADLNWTSSKVFERYVYRPNLTRPKVVVQLSSQSG